MKRKIISKSLRFAVFKRDKFRCVYCGATAEDYRLVIDHKHPICAGGDNSLDNLVTACEPCNQGKIKFDILMSGKSAGRPKLYKDKMIKRNLRLPEYLWNWMDSFNINRTQLLIYIYEYENKKNKKLLKYLQKN